MYATGAGTPSMIAELRLTRGQRILRELEVGDVVADDVFAAHRPVEVQVGHAARAYPPRAANDVDDDALVHQRLVLHRPIAIRRQVLRAFDTEHFLGLLAEDLVAGEPVQVEERLVDEYVAALGIEIDDRLGDVVREQPQLLLAAASSCSVCLRSWMSYSVQ